MRAFFTWPWLFTEAFGPTFPFEPFVSPSLTSWLCSVHSSPITTGGCSCRDAGCERNIFMPQQYPQTGDPVGRRDVVTLISISRLHSNFVVLGVLMVTLSFFHRVSSWQSRLVS